MRLSTGLLMLLLWPLSAFADPVLFEPPDFPSDPAGPSADHPGTDCFQLAGGSIEPGDVDWVQVVIPFYSLETVVDVDITSAEGNSRLMAWIVGGSVSVNTNDGNGAADGLCGPGAFSDPPGSLYDSALDVGDTPKDTVINIGITGYGDSGFGGYHTESFDYEVWVFAFVEDSGCKDDAECDDGIDCTVDTCGDASGECVNSPDDLYCDNGLFCDGAETCDPTVGCQLGEEPCLPDELCDEQIGCYSGVGPGLDVKPGGCPNFVNRRSRGYLKMALLGTADFDVNDIDMSTVLLSRMDGHDGALHLPGWMGEPNVILDDMGSPSDLEGCECGSDFTDGFVDALVRFRTPQVVEELGLYDFEPRDTVEVMVTGETYDGTGFVATDCIRLVDIHQGERRKDRLKAGQ
ncbi:MAG: hypothetical protein JSU63_21565 [Phycisphaerales bacterium]|nr:MAG: hypothetical protein JSU63_21565 [Phycisphaerales bacterium]